MSQKSIRIAALDISVRNTGVCVVDTNVANGSLIEAKVLRCHGKIQGRTKPGEPKTYEELLPVQRIDRMASKVLAWVRFYKPHLIVIEGYAYSSPRRTHLPAIAETTGIIKNGLLSGNWLFTIVSPSMLKKFATDHGNAKKDQMIDGVQKYIGAKGTVDDDDESDAIWLAVFGTALVDRTWYTRSGRVIEWAQHQKDAIERFEFPNYGTICSVEEVYRRCQNK